MEESQTERDIFDLNFQYPIVFDSSTVSFFNDIINSIEKGQEVFLNEPIKYRETIYPILLDAYLNQIIDFGIEEGKGYWVTKC